MSCHVTVPSSPCDSRRGWVKELQHHLSLVACSNLDPDKPVHVVKPTYSWPITTYRPLHKPCHHAVFNTVLRLPHQMAEVVSTIPKLRPDVPAQCTEWDDFSLITKYLLWIALDLTEMVLSALWALVCLSARPSVCLSVCHTRDQRLNGLTYRMPFAPYNRAILDARFLCGSWASCFVR